MLRASTLITGVVLTGLLALLLYLPCIILTKIKSLIL